MSKKRSSPNGFTLIELLVAMVILSVALAGMIPMLVYTTRGNSFGKSTTEGATLAQDLLEELRIEPFTLPSGAANGKLQPGTYTDPSPPAGLTRSWTITNTGGALSSDLIGIEVTTVWTDAQGTAHTSRCFTVRANLQ